MAVDIIAADSYIATSVIDIEDWTGSDAERKHRLLNVASKTLLSHFAQYTIPNNAVYEFAATLAILFNDTNRMQSQGITGFSVSGVASFTFKSDGVTSANSVNLAKMIPESVYGLVGEANGGIKIGRRKIGRSVR